MPREAKPSLPTVTPRPTAADTRSAQAAATDVLISLARLLARAAAREATRAGADKSHDEYAMAQPEPSARSVTIDRGRT